jgi:hypothetical protein
MLLRLVGGEHAKACEIGGQSSLRGVVANEEVIGRSPNRLPVGVVIAADPTAGRYLLRHGAEAVEGYDEPLRAPSGNC